MNSKGIWACLSCMACIERCPRSVEPARVIEAIRVAVARQQGMDHLKPEQIPGLLDEELPQQAIMSNAKNQGADTVITACPLCMYNLKENGGSDLPVVYFTELLAEALGVK